MIILPDDPIKGIWDLFTTVVLFFAFFWTPWRITFSIDSKVEWIVIDEVMDFIFFLDLIATFFTAYYNNKFILIDK